MVVSWSKFPCYNLEYCQNTPIVESLSKLKKIWNKGISALWRDYCFPYTKGTFPVR